MDIPKGKNSTYINHLNRDQVFLKGCCGEDDNICIYPPITAPDMEKEMSAGKPSYEELEKRLAEACEINKALREGDLRERLNKELEQKNRELEQIVYVTSHDLRSPLINIQGFGKELDYSVKNLLSVLESSDVPPHIKKKADRIASEDISVALKFIFTSIYKMDALLTGLLKLSRTGRVELNMEKIDMNRLISYVIKVLKIKIRKAGVDIKVSGLPDCKADITQTDALFSNLVENAIKFLDPGRPGFIYISGYTENGHSIYCVEDNGIGIAARHQKKIFEPFYKLRPETFIGDGLGLAIARRIVERHHGKMWLESEKGKGSRFYVRLQHIEG